MAVRLGGNVNAVLKVGAEEVKFTFREPTNRELNNFLSGRFNMRGKKMDDKSVEARVEFFDLLIVKIENVEDAQGQPITAEGKENIPTNWKNAAILEAFETTEVEIKN